MKFWLLSVVVGREEQTEGGVVDAAVHIDESALPHHLVAGVAALEGEGVHRHRLPSPGVIRGLEDIAALRVGDGDDAALVVGVDVVKLIAAAVVGHRQHAAVEVDEAAAAVAVDVALLVVAEVEVAPCAAAHMLHPAPPLMVGTVVVGDV